MTYELIENGILFYQESFPWWAWILVMIVPVSMLVGSVYFILKKAKDNTEKAFYFGFTLMSLPFLLLPFAFQSEYANLQIKLLKQNPLIEITDNRSTQAVQLEKAAVVTTDTMVETERDDEGRIKRTYHGFLRTNQNMTIELFETRNEDEAKDILLKTRSLLNSFEKQNSLTETTAAAFSKEMCLKNSGKIEAAYDPGTNLCRLSWDNKTGLALWIAVLLTGTGLYFCILLLKIKGKSVLLAGVTFFAALLFILFLYTLMKSAGSVIHLQYDESTVQTWTDSYFFGKTDEAVMNLSDIAFVSSSVGVGTIPMDFRSEVPDIANINSMSQILELIGKEASRTDHFSFQTAGLSVSDQFKLLDIFAAKPAKSVND